VNLRKDHYKKKHTKTTFSKNLALMGEVEKKAKKQHIFFTLFTFYKNKHTQLYATDDLVSCWLKSAAKCDN